VAGERIPATARGEATRRKLLEAAEAEFGGKGFHGASVSSITTRANLGQGTFYLYFRSKEEIFSVLVRELGHALRSHLAKDIAGAGRNRMQTERRGVEGFLQFTLEHTGVYRIVQEAQFVDEAAFRDYYQQLAERYSSALEQSAKRGELAKGSAEERAWAMMGISHFLGLRHCLWSGALPAKKKLDDVMDFIANGMAPRPTGTSFGRKR
jgi:AcrR family transcriptional regulator